MLKHRSVSFIKAFETWDESVEYLDKIVDPGVIIHLYCQDSKTDLYSELFAICTQSSVDSIQEELDQAKKEKSNVGP